MFGLEGSVVLIYPFLIAVGSTVGDNIASQSRYSLPSVTSSTVTSGSWVAADLRQIPVKEPSFS